MRSMRACARSLLLLTGLLIAGAVWSQEQRGWLGVETENLGEQEAGKLGLQAPRGAKIVHTVTGSPAAAAGLEPGEVIISLDGVNVENGQSLTESLKGKGAGATVRLRLVRADRERTVGVTLDARPEVYLLDEQAAALAQAGKYDEAMAVSQKALALGQRRFGADDTILGVLLLRIAEIHERQGRYAEAEPFYQRCLAVLEKARGSDHVWVAGVLDELAGLYQRQKRNDAAEPLYRRALSIYTRAQGPEHPDVANVLIGLGRVYRAQKRLDQAIPLHERAVAIREKALGPDHPDVGAALSMLAFDYMEATRYA